VAKQAAIDAEKAADEAEAAKAGNSNVQNGHYSTETDKQSELATVHVEVTSESEPEKKTPTFREHVKAVTCISNATLSRDLKINDNLTEEQFSCLDAVQCTKLGMLKIIDSTKDLGKRGEIVSLVASGVEVENAIADVLGVTTTKDVAGRVKEVGDVTVKADAELSDEEWFLKECGTFSDLLSDHDQYKADAILYRQIDEARHKFRKSVKNIIEQYKQGRQGKNVGWFFLSLYQILNISHPKDWLMCGDCGGKGSLPGSTEPCKACGGSCYKTKTERYV
jgi:hypothetical protein